MNAILIDDEPLARTIVKEYLEKHSSIEVVAECNDGFEGVKAIQQWKPDLVFLDIQMPKINGFEMLELVSSPPPVIFTTAFDEYAIKAFESHAIDYLLKPFSQDRFDKAMEKFMSQSGMQHQVQATEKLLQEEPVLTSEYKRIVVKTGGKIKIIPVPTIEYIEAADDYVKIITAEGSFLKNKTMSFYERCLPQHTFVRVHRSYIVNLQEITRIDPYEKESHLAILRSGARLPVSKAGYANLKEVLGL
jgi:two-component system, LytTR family, response regulator